MIFSSVADTGCLFGTFYPSRIRIPDLGSRISDPGSRIPDPTTATNEREKLLSYFFVATNIKNLNIFIF
jgi:hypothetical protein